MLLYAPPSPLFTQRTAVNATLDIHCQCRSSARRATHAAFNCAAMIPRRVVGPKSGQIPPHRVLACETEVGKTSIVRQLEPEVHIDGSIETVGALR